MIENARVDELLAYLRELKGLNEDGMYNCHKEIAEAVDALRYELDLSENNAEQKFEMVVKAISQKEAKKIFEEVEKEKNNEVKVIKR